MSGLFGVISKGNCTETLFYGTDYHSHLGTQKAGLAVFNHEIQRSIHDISTSQFKSKFADDLVKLKGKIGIGVISDKDSQPIIISSSFGIFALVASGLLLNKDQLAKEMMKEGGSFSELSGGEINATEVVGKLIAQKKDIVEGIENVFGRAKGSISLLVLTREGIFCARDKLGRTPLVVGKSDDGWAVTSETCAFPNLGFETKKELLPGEIVLLSKDGVHEEKSLNNGEKICAFLWIYTGYPASVYDGVSVETVRERCGANLAKEDKMKLHGLKPVVSSPLSSAELKSAEAKDFRIHPAESAGLLRRRIKADLVTGVPDSGIAHALGYAMASGIPYRRPLVKYSPGYGRSYTPPTQKIRDQVAKMKLIAIEEVARGKSIVICDDSIVRGTQLKNQAIAKLWKCGAKEIHARIACPPLMFPCRYCLSTRTNKELAARRAIKKSFGKRGKSSLEGFLNEKSPQYKKMVENIRQELGVTSLRYQSVDDMVKAIGLPKQRLCLYCWIGKE